MSVIFFDGFDFYTLNSLSAGGRKWDQGSSAQNGTGRFGGQAARPGSTYGFAKTLPDHYPELIVGFAIQVHDYTGSFGGPEFPSHPIFTFYDGTTAQCSIWIDATTQVLKVRTGRGELIGDSDLLVTGFVPPLTLWFYLECRVTIGNPGSVELKVNGTSMGSASGVQTQQSGNATANKIAVSAYNNYSGGVQAGAWSCDDLYVVDPNDATGSVDYLGEVRVQTKYPDADGFQTDFFRSTGPTNSGNVNTAVVDYSENGHFNYSGTVGAKDLYSIGNFTVSGTNFAVQENISFRKDDVGNRNICPLLRTASTEYEGSSFPCYSSYTYAGKIWEENPSTLLPWALVDLNTAEFGIKVKS